jgi:undecaprenyl-diphosphatase
MLTWWQAIVLGLVEGITEYLPVSSTGHLILAAALLGLERPDVKASVDVFLVVVQGGAILAVLALYWPRVAQMVRGLAGRDPDGRRLAVQIAIAFAPSAVVALVLGSRIRAALFGPWPVLVALAAGGVWMIWLGRRRTGRADLSSLTYGGALVVGLAQVLALWPGMSRSMVTISGGMLLGLDGAAAAEFSFLLGLPTLAAACLHDVVGELRHGGDASMFHRLGPGPVGLGIAVATVSAALAVRWLVRFLNRHGIAPFGWYRLAAAALFAALLLTGRVATP